ncbi:MAG TPA: hypothetical protein VKF36_15195 [Syntrophorhabdales bacterium]|nr:hypothetical protein [Syntrophorhabdales bacterium]
MVYRIHHNDPVEAATPERKYARSNQQCGGITQVFLFNEVITFINEIGCNVRSRDLTTEWRD